MSASDEIRALIAGSKGPPNHATDRSKEAFGYRARIRALKECLTIVRQDEEEREFLKARVVAAEREDDE